MTDEELQALQQTVLDLQEKQKNYDLEKQAWETEKTQLTQKVETLQTTADTYKDMNAKLSLNLATQMTSPSVVSVPGNTSEETKPVDNTPSLDDIIKDL
ncbi:hypothetical protein phiCP7R_0022 [Clostridium phage phiCP7R]|uniref:Uncharacterized protein n=4 Tax=Brucesealvirus TaxID=2842570 RepID=A0AA45H8W5_9CAUD|nr:hypothetical protein phiCP7R_0022 [Clostridium phage phiCP7R]YP_006488637.1 hypothetical protein PHICPV4_gp22 [Clostridium phage phiCPV4]QPB10355.2 hypothetical protein [Clostridium phage CPQ1]QXG83164.1 hypothetical protein cpx_00009 [Clostridium phage cpx]QYC53195.1 hypothetical protein [Clostridium phage CPQ7]QYC53205.1 hypothetical protein [Clostridium phage CPQ9]QYC53233.1 hypothetical protein [Clostridium phage CPQ10]UIW13678.1 hypothetical protein [Clostridium phage CPQ8]